VLATFNLQGSSLFAQGTAFTYQGRLNSSGSPASGSYDLVFTLYTTNTAGTAMAGPVTNVAVAVTTGLFTTLVDFGPNAFTGTSNWLEIAVRTNGGSSFNTLAPRVPVTPAPYAVTAESANNLAGLSVQPNPSSGAPNLIGGSSVNFVSSGVVGATIGGGGATTIYAGKPRPYAYTNSVTGSFGTVGGGAVNTAASEATVAGGQNNTASSQFTTVGGGYANSASGTASTVGGGYANVAYGISLGAATVAGGFQNIASDDATVGGGFNNQATNAFATVPGGANNVAGGQASFAAGNGAQALHDGAFVWADSEGGAPFASTTTNQFNVRANGGVRFVTGGAGLTVDGPLSGSGATVWQVPASTTVQAQSNTGYLLTNIQTVTVTLPAAPNVGDVVEVFEAGAGGWTLAQNATQSVLYNVVSASNNTWVQTSAPSEVWTCIACSADGTKLAAGTVAGAIYTSSNSGANWNLTSAADGGDWWAGIASSADGSKLAAAVYHGGIYTSSDFGADWTLTSAPSTIWSSIACSADGTKLVAGVDGGGIYTSINSGTNWVQTPAPSGNWTVVTASSDGTKLAAANYGGGVYTSTNSGASWIQSSAPSAYWNGLASSSDGGRLAAAATGKGIYTLSYFSTNWIKTSAPSTNWDTLASSADGSSLAAIVLYGENSIVAPIFTSSDSGGDWVQASAPLENWSCIACSADGTKLAAAIGYTFYSTGYPGGIWTAGYGRSPVSTSTGTGGFLGGGQGSGVKLIYAGGGQFVLVAKQGSIYGE